MNDESRAKLIMSIHKLFGAPISEATKAYDLIIEYFTLKSNMGDHPEECKPREYILVEKKISDDAINRQDAIRIAEHGQVQGYEMKKVRNKMSDVELVIKLPEETYNLIKSDLYNTFPAEIKEAIKNGTLLPKGHGRLIDADELDRKMRERNRDRGFYYSGLPYVPTII